ncbi:MAG: formimidoylglutamase [Bacteroidota bacterium]
MQDLRSFFAPVHYAETIDQNTFQPLQWGAQIEFPSADSFYFDEADIIIIGCGEIRGEHSDAKHYSDAPDAIREQFYKLYNWHSGIKVFDAGNILQGATIDDSRAALRVVLQELHQAGKIVIILGGSHDLTLQQYEVFKQAEQIINASVVDMLVDLDETESTTSSSFLMEMLTGSPNFINHYNHIGFQSYFVNPVMLETLDKIRFDFFRLGRVKEHIEDMEPVLRNSHLLSFDMNAVKYSDAPMNKMGSPNGLAGDEACLLTRFAGMSSALSSFGIYGFDERKDKDNMTAILAAQMIWYFVDGFFLRKNEASLSDKNEFVEYHLQFTGNDIMFLKSKRSNRWWMQLPDGNFEPCSYSDYLLASENEIPERWLRIQERS